MDSPQQRTFRSRMMRSNLRPVVLFIAFATGFWSFLWAVSSFRLVSDADVDEVPGLKNAALIMGILYSVAAVIQICGLYAASMRNVKVMRIYVFGSIITALCILAGNLARTIIHFTQKKALLSVCTNDNTGDTVFYSWGIWGPVTSSTLDQADAANWCNQAWNHSSWVNIITFLIVAVIAAFFLFVIFGYYKQLQDPSNSAYAARPQGQYPLGPYPRQQSAGAYGNFAPPPGPPPALGFDQPFVPPYDSTKLPAYDGSGPNYGDGKDGDGLLKDGNEDPFGDNTNDIGRSGR